MTTSDVDEQASSEAALDRRWELVEVVPAAVVVTVGLGFVGSMVYLFMSLSGQFNLTAFEVSTYVVSALRWSGSVTSVALLAAAALVWWQCEQWSGRDDESTPSDAAILHITRSRALSKWIMAAFVVVLASAVGEIVSSIVAGWLGPPNAQGWAVPIYSIFLGIASGLLAVVGVVAVARILAASEIVTSAVEPADQP
ncbi:MAG TPA: hypothetical protein VGS61_03185 [Acidimicrobiales bacterium]|nr:hypothetical protein [Acidimicrobiales bacterium]